MINHVQVVRACQGCGRLYAPKRGQRYCSVACRGESQRRPGAPAAGGDHLAALMVRGWSPARRARIRAQSLELGEAGLVELIDRAEAEGQ